MSRVSDVDINSSYLHGNLLMRSFLEAEINQWIMSECDIHG